MEEKKPHHRFFRSQYPILAAFSKHDTSSYYRGPEFCVVCFTSVTLFFDWNRTRREVHSPFVPRVHVQIPVQTRYLPTSMTWPYRSRLISDTIHDCKRDLFKVYITWKVFPAYLKGLSKLSRMAFFFLKYLFRLRHIDIFLVCKLDQWWRHKIFN